MGRSYVTAGGVYVPGSDSESESNEYIDFSTLIQERNFKAVDQLLQDHPDLLYYKCSWANQYLPGDDEQLTGFQAALRAHDYQMWQVIVKHFDNIENGDETKAEQFNKEFPNGVDFPDSDLDFDDFVNALNDSDYYQRYEIIQDAQTDDSFFDDAIDDIISAIKRRNAATHFNPNHMLSAFAVYEAEYARSATDYDDDNDSEGEETSKDNIFWKIVIKPLQRGLPVTYQFPRSQYQSFTVRWYFESFRDHVNSVETALTDLANEIQSSPCVRYVK